MATINFPSSPIQGQVYEFGDYRYTFDGVKWVSIAKYGASAVKIQSATPPPSPEAGLQWFDDVSGRNYFWHINETGGDGQWVEESPQGIVEIDKEVDLAIGGLTGTVRVGNISDYVGVVLESEDSKNTYQYPDSSNEWYGVKSGTTFPQTVPADPTGDVDWTQVHIGVLQDLPSNPNLLINGDFSVWQRGEVLPKDKTLTYGADRWAVNGVNTSGTIKRYVGIGHDFAMGYEPTEAGSYQILQRVECYKSLEDRQVALTMRIAVSAGISDVRLRIYDGVNGAGTILEKIITPTSGHNYYTLTGLLGKHMDDAKYWTVDVLFSSNSGSGALTISEAKLELGSVATPFVPDLPQVNLSKCQRYYRTGTVFAGQMQVASGNAYALASEVVDMRAKPVVVATENLYFSVSAEGSVYSEGPSNKHTLAFTNIRAEAASIGVNYRADAEL